MWHNLTTTDPTALLIQGLIVGIVFGFLLQKARVTRYATILGQFLFTDFTVLKVMLTAIVVGGAGVWAMLQLDMIQHLHVKAAALGANLVGGLIFGVGMAILGYCPGTGVAAIGDGSRHAIPGVLGMIVGAGLFAETYPLLQANLLTWADQGKATFPSMTGLSPWVFLIALAVIALIVFTLIERHEGRKTTDHA
jgi:uncharacterized membrane protein YedE/YeeE